MIIPVCPPHVCHRTNTGHTPDKYLYEPLLLLASRHCDRCLSGHIRMVVELLIITYYVIAVPVALWAIFR